MTREDDLLRVLGMALANRSSFNRMYLFDKYNDKVFIYSVNNEKIETCFKSKYLAQDRSSSDYYNIIEEKSIEAIGKYKKNDLTIIELLPMPDLERNEFIDNFIKSEDFNDFLDSMKDKSLIKERVYNILNNDDIFMAHTQFREIHPKLSFIYSNDVSRFTWIEIQKYYLPLGIDPDTTEVMW